MRQSVRSFAIAYVSIPAAFYAVNALGHLRALAVYFPIVLNVLLVFTSTAAYYVLYRGADRFRIRSPIALAAGASLGLIHWFPLYAILGGWFIWGGNQGADPSDLFALLKLALLNLVFPVYTLSGGSYDGSVPAILLSVILFLFFGSIWKLRLRAAA